MGAYFAKHENRLLSTLPPAPSKPRQRISRQQTRSGAHLDALAVSFTLYSYPLVPDQQFSSPLWSLRFSSFPVSSRFVSSLVFSRLVSSHLYLVSVLVSSRLVSFSFSFSVSSSPPLVPPPPRFPLLSSPASSLRPLRRFYHPYHRAWSSATAVLRRCGLGDHEVHEDGRDHPTRYRFRSRSSS